MQKIVKFNRAFLYCCMVVMLCLHPLFTRSEPLQGKPLTISIKNTSLAEVLRQVSKKSGLYIYFQDADLAAYSSVSIDVKNKSVDAVLHELLDGRGFVWVEVDKNTVAIKKKEDRSKRDDQEKLVHSDTTVSVRGRVTDEKGNPLSGVNITVKGSRQGTSTIDDGSFVINNVKYSAKIVIISMIGYETIEQKIPDSKILIANLRTLTNELDETVVIAYGTTTKRLSTGNISTIRAKDIAKQPVQNPLLALQGRVPGIVIEQANGLPGSGVTVRIQGQNSLSRGSDPLYVIDGIPYTQQLLPSLSGILGNSGNGDGTVIPPNGNPLSFINPADIESIDVLKDADATSIYGSRAAAGAILITTKKGKVGETKIDLNFQTGWGKITKMLNLLNTNQYLEMRKEAYKNDGFSVPISSTAPDYSNYDLTFWDQNRYTDWQRELIGGTAKYNDMQLSVSGGNTNTQFLVNGAYHKETTVFPSNLGDQKGAMHFNLNNMSANQKFKLQLDGKYMIDNNRIIGSDLTGTAIVLAPNAPTPYNSDGSLNWQPLPDGTSSFSSNPMANLLSKFKSQTKNLLANALLSYQLLPGLHIKSSFGYTNMQINEIAVSPSNATIPEYRPFISGYSSFGYGTINSWTIEPQITYKTRIGAGTLDGLVGSTFLQNNKNRQAYDANGFNSDLQLEDIKSASTVTVSSTLSTIYRYNAIFGRINYNLNDKYIINLSIRRDGSSRYGSENLFHNFGSIAGAWLFSNETYVKNNLSFLSFGKLKVSYGTTGNDQIGDYQFMSLYTSRNRPVPYQNTVGLTPNGLTNPYLQWEKTRKLQAGIDLGFFSDRILLNMNYYNNRSSNQLQRYALPLMSGFGFITENLPATIQNTGWELSLNTFNIKNRYFSWNSNINLTIPRNKLVSYPGIETSTVSDSYIIGQSITSVKVYKYLGIDSKTGIYLVADKDGNVVDFPNYTEDRTVIINTAPSLYGGIQNSFSYKSFRLDFLFQFVRQIGLNYTFGDRPGAFFGYNGNQPVSVLNRWQNKEDNAQIAKFSTDGFPSYIDNLGGSNAVYSDASYIRLKNVSLSWELPTQWKNKVHLANAQLFLHGQNILTITNYSGIDPETRSTSSLPPLRVLTIGFQITL